MLYGDRVITGIRINLEAYRGSAHLQGRSLRFINYTKKKIYVCCSDIISHGIYHYRKGDIRVVIGMPVVPFQSY